MNRLFLVPAAAMLLATLAAAQGPDLGTDEQRAAGKVVYDKYCAQCHGVDGDGQGAAAPRVKPKPRDLTAGKYKIRTTPNGALPTHDDLKNIIRRGMPYSSMPAWPQLSEQQLDNVVYYIKSFAPDFAEAERKPEAISIPKPPPITDESVETGRGIYEELGCARCHGELGRGDGMSAPTLRDDWGNHLMPVDMTKRWTFRGGPRRQDIFRAFSTGINGTPMPSYSDALEEDRRWDLVNYIHSLGKGDDPDYAQMVTAKKVAGGLDLESAEDPFAGAEPAYFPIVGQIIQPGREFFPSCNGVEVRAVYNDSEIAIELRWHDMRAETSGSNAPDLEVPRFEDDPAPRTEQDEDQGGGFWGDEAEDEQGDFWGDEASADEGGDDFWGEGDSDSAPAGPDTEFSDAVAIQFPQQPSPGVEKPYFLFGDARNPVDLWFWDLGSAAPEQWIARGSDTLTSQGVGDLAGTASYDRGEWTVRFKRSLRSPGGVPLEEGRFVPVAFSVWDGFNRERGNKRGLSQWQYVYLEPGGERSVVAPMLKAAGIALVVEILLVALIRRRYAGASTARDTAPEASGARA